MTINKIIDFVKIFNRYSLKELGFFYTLKCALGKIGINGYSVIKYPVSNIKVTVRSSVGWKKIEYGLWEYNCFKLLSGIIDENYTIFDVGSYSGVYTLYFSNMVKNNGKVYSFEPDIKIKEKLVDHIRKNKLENVVVETLALSNIVGNTALMAEQFGKSFSTIVKSQIKTKYHTMIVPVTTIDIYCKEHHIIPNLIKIDVEGAEGLVIEGGLDTILNFSPEILLEFHDNRLSDKERKEKWDKIHAIARKVIFIDGDSRYYQYGDVITKMPDCLLGHIFITTL